jgi:hypothetical protein
MSKRPSLIAGLMAPQSDPAIEAPMATSIEAALVAKAAAPKLNSDVTRTSIYLPKPVYRRLKEIALTTDRKVHDLFMEGIDATLRKYGHPGVSELKGGK